MNILINRNNRVHRFLRVFLPHSYGQPETDHSGNRKESSRKTLRQNHNPLISTKMNTENEVKELKKFAALTKRKNVNEAWQTRVIFTENKAAAETWFGENNFEIHGEVYRSGK